MLQHLPETNTNPFLLCKWEQAVRETITQLTPQFAHIEKKKGGKLLSQPKVFYCISSSGVISKLVYGRICYPAAFSASLRPQKGGRRQLSHLLLHPRTLHSLANPSRGGQCQHNGTRGARTSGRIKQPRKHKRGRHPDLLEPADRWCFSLRLHRPDTATHPPSAPGFLAGYMGWPDPGLCQERSAAPNWGVEGVPGSGTMHRGCCSRRMKQPRRVPIRCATSKGNKAKGIREVFCSPVEKSAALLHPGSVLGQTQHQHLICEIELRLFWPSRGDGS